MDSIFGQLFELGPHGTIIPDMATGYTFSNGGKTVTINLRPGCGTVAEHVHEYVTNRPRDVRHGAGEAEVCLVKRRWACENGECPRSTFTESLPQVPPRCRIARRLLEQAGCEVRDRGITPAEAARHAGISWPSAHEAFAAAADPVLDEPSRP
jgi:transposase